MNDDATPTREAFRFVHPLRVRWAEVDMQEIVFNAHCLMYFDTALGEYWRAMALRTTTRWRCSAATSMCARRLSISAHPPAWTTGSTWP